MFFFFFSSRRRHTRSLRDWSSDVCSSDLENQRYTYAGFLAGVNGVARALMALGVEKGDRVGIWSTNCVVWVLVQFATAKIGAILVNINPACRTYELEFALRQSECNYLISGEGFKDADFAQMLHELIPELGGADPHEDLRAEKFPHLRRIVWLVEATQPGGALQPVPPHEPCNAAVSAASSRGVPPRERTRGGTSR